MVIFSGIRAKKEAEFFARMVGESLKSRSFRLYSPDNVAVAYNTSRTTPKRESDRSLNHAFGHQGLAKSSAPETHHEFRRRQAVFRTGRRPVGSQAEHAEDAHSTAPRSAGRNQCRTR